MGKDEAEGSRLPPIEGLGWFPDSRQVEGRKTEREILRKRGALAHPNSGAGNIKDDGHDDERLYEIKDARKSHTLKGADLEALRRRAARQGLEGTYIVYFSDLDLTLEGKLYKGHHNKGA